MSIVSGNIRTSARVALLSTSSAVTLPQSEEIRMRSCAIAGWINPSVMTKALKSSLNIQQQLLVLLLFPAERQGAFLAIGQRARFSKTSFATGIAENTLGHPT